jgi:hypothetical protein
MIFIFINCFVTLFNKNVYSQLKLSHDSLRVIFYKLTISRHMKASSTYRSLHDVKISSIKCKSLSCIAILKA